MFKIPRAVIPRLSVYYRTITAYTGSGIISSKKLSELTGFTAAQIRKDLAYFGQFGTPGRGYMVSELKKEIFKILGIDKLWNVALVGIGNLGTALLSYRGFKEQGFHIVAAFDNDPSKIGRKIAGIKIENIKDIRVVANKKQIKMAIVAVPGEGAQNIIKDLIKAGVKAILNFAPVRPSVPASIELLNIDLSIELEKLAHFLA